MSKTDKGREFVPGLGARLRSARKRKELTQEGLAKSVDLSKGAVSSFELDNSTPDLTTLVKLAERLEESLDDLVFGAHADARRIAEKFLALPEPRRRTVLALMDEPVAESRLESVGFRPPPRLGMDSEMEHAVERLVELLQARYDVILQPKTP